VVWPKPKNCRYIEKLTNIKLTENISDRIWIHETHYGINRYLIFGQLKHNWCTLSARGAWLYNTSGKVITLGLPKSVCCVPAPTVSEYLQNIADYINQSLIFMMYKSEQ